MHGDTKPQTGAIIVRAELSAPLPTTFLRHPRGQLPGGRRMFLGHGSAPRRDEVMGAVETEQGPWGGCLRAAGALGATSYVTR